MIDVEREDLISLRQATKLRELRRDGRAPHIATLWRWTGSGRLESVKVGGLTLTSRQAVARMIAAANGTTPAAIAPGARRRELRGVDRELLAAGI